MTSAVMALAGGLFMSFGFGVLIGGLLCERGGRQAFLMAHGVLVVIGIALVLSTM